MAMIHTILQLVWITLDIVDKKTSLPVFSIVSSFVPTFIIICLFFPLSNNVKKNAFDFGLALHAVHATALRHSGRLRILKVV